MDPTPSKRRKLSPMTAIAVDASNTVIAPSSKDGRPTMPARASFMSPTKASLARFNPNLLPRSRSVGTSAQAEFAVNANQPQSPRRLNALPLRPTTPTSDKKRFSASPVRPLSTSPTKKTQPIAGSLSAPPRRQSGTPGRASEPVSTPSDTQVQTISNPPSRPPQVNDVVEATLPSAQAMPTKESRRDPGNLTANSLSRTVGHEAEEPQLPPTPEELGLEARPEPPKGILSSSPTRRVTRRRAALKKSPLKPRDEPVDGTSGGIPQPPADTQNLPLFATTDPEAQRIGDTDEVDDPEVARRKELLEQLFAQKAQLEADVTILGKAIENNSDTALGQPAAEERVKLLSILTVQDPSRNPTKAQPKPLTVSNKLSLFLPFSKAQAPVEEPPLEQAPPASHHPLSLDDPLPYLHAFTTLDISSTNTLVSADSNVPLLQKEFKLTSPTSILNIKIVLVTNTVTQTMTSLRLSSISSWADAELGTWIRKQEPLGDISSIGWACSRYWEVASTRAKCWARCKARFPFLVSSTHQDQPETVDSPAKNPKRKKGRPKKGPRTAMQGQGGEESTSERHLSASVPRSDFVANISSQSLLFSRSDVSLLISWHIGFDWIGEVESDISAVTSFPRTWRNADERGSLGKVGEAFDRLVRERGVLDGIRIMVQLIFPDD